MIALVLSTLAHADDLTWTCPTLDVPADGAVFRDPEATGVREFSDAVEAIARGYFDTSCPEDDLDSTQACHTAAGDAIAIAATYKGVDVVIVPASGALTKLTANADYGVPYSMYWSVLHDDLDLTVSWEGTADDAWPADQVVVVEVLSEMGYFGPDPLHAASWDDGSCVWSVTEEPDDTLADTTNWRIESGGQELEVVEGPATACMPLGAQATLDGRTAQVYPETWTTPEGDADGDGFTVELGDCDDADATIFPCATTTECDTIDHDCDGTAWGDEDGDGYLGCEDCDDTRADVNPASSDPDCDGVDQDCDGLDGPDADGDRHSVCDDCDDADSTIHPGRTDTDCDGIDKDCDGLDSLDNDDDGYTDCDDCNDENWGVNPGAVDLGCDGRDWNCDGEDAPDADGDGYIKCDDCDDGDASRHPGATDSTCDGTDQDCDGRDGPDADGDGYTTCEDCDDAAADTHPGGSDTDCDGIDQDCDGMDGPDADGDGYTECEECDDGDADVHPGATDIPGDGIDQDCDGADTPSPAAPQAGEAREKPESSGCATVRPPGGVWGLWVLLLCTRRRARCSSW